jgi:hypothetical protein
MWIYSTSVTDNTAFMSQRAGLIEWTLMDLITRGYQHTLVPNFAT